MNGHGQSIDVSDHQRTDRTGGKAGDNNGSQNKKVEAREASSSAFVRLLLARTGTRYKYCTYCAVTASTGKRTSAFVRVLFSN